MKNTSSILLKTAALALAFAPGSLRACATCFGDPNSAEVKGISMGILVLLGVVFMILGFIAAFMIYLARRSRWMPINHSAGPGVRRFNDARGMHS